MKLVSCTFNFTSTRQTKGASVQGELTGKWEGAKLPGSKGWSAKVDFQISESGVTPRCGAERNTIRPRWLTVSHKGLSAVELTGRAPTDQLELPDCILVLRLVEHAGNPRMDRLAADDWACVNAASVIKREVLCVIVHCQPLIPVICSVQFDSHQGKPISPYLIRKRHLT